MVFIASFAETLCQAVAYAAVLLYALLVKSMDTTLILELQDVRCAQYRLCFQTALYVNMRVNLVKFACLIIFFSEVHAYSVTIALATALIVTPLHV